MDLKKYIELAGRTAPPAENAPDMTDRAIQARVWKNIEEAYNTLAYTEKLKKWVNKAKPYAKSKPPALDSQKLMDPKKIMSLYAVMGLMGELHEVMYCLFGKGQNDESLQAELADISWYIAMLVRENGLDWDQALEDNVAKLAARYNIKEEQEDGSTPDSEE